MRLVKITVGEHIGEIAHITSQAPQYGLVCVTPIYGDPLASISLRTHQVKSIHGHWVCDKCKANGITAHLHKGCEQGAIFQEYEGAN